MKFTTETYTNKTEILKFPDHYVGVAVTVDDEGIVVNADGKKIVPAGTIVGGKTKSALDNLDEPVQKKNTQGVDADKAEGILFSDVDVTYGSAPGTMIIHGFIDVSKLPEAVAADAVTALKLVKLIK